MINNYQTSSERVSLSLIVGTVFYILGIMFLNYVFDAQIYLKSYFLSISGFLSVFNFVFFCFVLTAGPIWLLLHRFGYRQIWALALAFFVGPALAYIAIYRYVWEQTGLIQIFASLEGGLFLMLLVFTGALIWRVAYYRV